MTTNKDYKIADFVYVLLAWVTAISMVSILIIALQ
jgi:hypothetical protein